MAEHLVDSMTPKDIGELVASEFARGDTHVLVHGFPLFNERGTQKYDNNREESDDKIAHYARFDHLPQYGRRYLRHKNMLEVCEKLAALETFEDGERVDPLRTLEVVGPRGAVLSVDRPIFHTEEASLPDPSRIVSYWDAQPLSGTGDTVHILSVDDLWKWVLDRDDGRDPLDKRVFLNELGSAQEFTKGGRFKAPIYDQKQGTLRYHNIFRDSTASRGGYSDDETIPLTKIEEFFDMAFKEGLGKKVQLQPGSVLFIDNHRAAHAVEFEVNPRRLTYQLFIHALKADALAGEPPQEIIEEAS